MGQTFIRDSSDFGQAVRAARKRAGLSQARLSERCGCSQRFVSELERGKPTAELGRALRLFDELGIPLVAGEGSASVDGRAEVRYAIVRIAEELDAPARKRKKLAQHLEEAFNEP